MRGRRGLRAERLVGLGHGRDCIEKRLVGAAPGILGGSMDVDDREPGLTAVGHQGHRSRGMGSAG